VTALNSGVAAARQGIRDIESERILAGIGLVLLAVACFATLDTATKVSTAAVPILMGVWVRYAFQAIATTLVLLPKHGTTLLRTRHPLYQLLRGALLLASSTLAFFSLRYMPLAEFTSIVLIAPLVITLLAATALKEHVSPLRWALVAGGFTGTLVILRPGGDAFSWAMLLPIGLVLTNAWFQVLTSKLAQTENPLTMHFYTGWVGTLLASFAAPFGGARCLPGTGGHCFVSWGSWGPSATSSSSSPTNARRHRPSRPISMRRSLSRCLAAGSCSRTCPTISRWPAWR
jgi:drug/metabolite transporter (DMT)-like permease